MKPFVNEVQELQECICRIEESLSLWITTQDELLRLENILIGRQIKVSTTEDKQLLLEGRKQFDRMRYQYFLVTKNSFSQLLLLHSFSKFKRKFVHKQLRALTLPN